MFVNQIQGTWSVSGGHYNEASSDKIFDGDDKTFWRSEDYTNDYFEVEFHVCLFTFLDH